MGKNMVTKGLADAPKLPASDAATKIAGRMTPPLRDCDASFPGVPGGSCGSVFRFALNGRTRDMGLGAYPTITLAMAREKALLKMRRVVADGVDPIERRLRYSLTAKPETPDAHL